MGTIHVVSERPTRFEEIWIGHCVTKLMPYAARYAPGNLLRITPLTHGDRRSLTAVVTYVDRVHDVPGVEPDGVLAVLSLRVVARKESR